MIKVNGNLVRELIVVECRNNKWNEIRMRAYTYDIRNRFVLKIEIRCDEIGKGMNGERGNSDPSRLSSVFVSRIIRILVDYRRITCPGVN